MTDRKLDITRRKVLAGIGTIGAAGAAAGIGTSAYFSDTESFEGNMITAGTLDLKVDWEEHYSYPQLYGFDDPAASLDVSGTDPGDDAYVPLPDPANPAVWIHDDDLDSYMDNTAIESFPDADDDGVQDGFETDQIGTACEDGADDPASLDPEESLRTANADTVGVEGSPLPIVNLDDVKPGDFGEVTLSFHLCTNPGYVWLAGELVEAAENGHTEPESAADAENGASDEVVTELGQGDDVELLDEIQTTVWYDGDCDNVLDGGEEGEEGEPADVLLVLDRSGSMFGNKIQSAKTGAKNLVDALGPNDQVGLVSFSHLPSRDADLTSSHMGVKTAIGGLTAGGGTDMDEGLEQAHEELLSGDQFSSYGESGNARPGARQIMIVLGDGRANISDEATAAKNDGIELFTIAYGSNADTSTLESMASDPKSDHFFEADVSDIEELLESLGGEVGSAGEEVLFRGSLRETLAELESSQGIPLDGDPSSEGRSCYPGLQTHCVGLAWHLPADVGNHVQSDSVSFDLGFYGEQCRNNDGSGQAAD